MKRNILVLALGLLVVSGAFTAIDSYFIRITPDWLLRYL